jgi:hypothetical protein
VINCQKIVAIWQVAAFLSKVVFLSSLASSQVPVLIVLYEEAVATKWLYNEPKNYWKNLHGIGFSHSAISNRVCSSLFGEILVSSLLLRSVSS